MKTLVVLALICSFTPAFAAEKIKMNFANEDLLKVIQTYSKASGQKFMLDPAVRGKISIFQSEPVTVEEAFNQLSSALAMNGFAISKHGDMMEVRSARNVQRDLIEVSTEVPAIKPERMYTWVYTPKNLTADGINREMRILSSKDGEMVSHTDTNQLIFTDWVSNINRIAALMKEVDKPADSNTAKLIDAAKKQQEIYRKEQASKNGQH